MSSRRATNNSTVSSLEEQNQVLASVMDQQDGLIKSNTSTSSDKVKSSSRKKAKSKTGQSDPVLEPPRGQATRSDVTPSAVAAPVAKAARSVSKDAQPLPDNLPGYDLGADGALPYFDAGAAGDMGAGFPLAHQQWMWQQQQQMLALQQLQQFGNFVPNFAFGGGPLNVAWGQEDEASVGGEADQASQPQQGRPIHEISDEEEEDDVQVVPLPGVAPPIMPFATGAQLQGSVADLIKVHLAKVKDGDKVSPKVNDDVAGFLQRYLGETHFLAEMERLAKTYHRVENVPLMTVPRLDEELFHVIDHKVRNADQGFQAVQRGVTGALSAFAPVMALACSRGKNDPELVDLANNLVEGMQLLAYAHSAISSKRRELIRPELSPLYARPLTKSPDGGDPEWLFGGKLAETAKQCEAVKQIGIKISKRKPPQPQQKGNHQKKFRPAFQQPAFPVVRAYNPWQQNIRFPAPQQGFTQGFQQFPTPFFGGFPRRFRPRYQNQSQRQGFQKKGAQHK